MRYVPELFAACCAAIILAVLVSVHPVAGQGPETGAARQQLDEVTSMVLSTRLRAVPTSERWEMWHPDTALLLGSLGVDPRARRDVQLVSGQTVRSKTRTAIGTGLLAVGGLAVYFGYFLCGIGGADAALYTASYSIEDDACVLDPYPDWRHNVFTEHAPNYSVMAGGAGAIGLGLLLTTVWADVEVRRSQSGVEVQMPIWSR